MRRRSWERLSPGLGGHRLRSQSDLLFNGDEIRARLVCRVEHHFLRPCNVTRWNYADSLEDGVRYDGIGCAMLNFCLHGGGGGQETFDQPNSCGEKRPRLPFLNLPAWPISRRSLSVLFVDNSGDLQIQSWHFLRTGTRSPVQSFSGNSA